MSQTERPAATHSSLARGAAWCSAHRHFLVAAVLLAVAAGGWSAAVRVMQIAAEKSPVPWPPPVQVNEQFRMTSLPARIGPYELVRGTPGDEEGEIKLDDYTLEMLKIGTFTAGRLRERRMSNWMTIRHYRDHRLAENHPARLWRLEVYYYTGGVDPVPHVPEICGVQAGARHLGTERIGVPAPAAAPAPWAGGDVSFNKVLFEDTDRAGLLTRQYVQYYVLCVNGRPETDRNRVRLKLASPFLRHAYFAKIQFAPLLRAATEPAEADGQAREFARHFLPEVLRMLPTAEEVAAMEARK